MPQPQPLVASARTFQVRQRGLLPVADVEEITEHRHRGALLTVPEERGDRHAEELAQQIEERAFQRRGRVDGRSLIEGLRAATCAVPVGEALANLRDDVPAGADGFADDQGPRVLEGLPDPLAPGDLSQAGVSGVVPQDDDVAREDRRVRSAQIEEHAVIPGDRDDEHLADDGSAR